MNDKDNRRQFARRTRPPKGPVKLAFGIVTKPVAPDANARPEGGVPVQKPAEPAYARAELIGTLQLKGVKIDFVEPLKDKYLDRIRKNLENIYNEGRHLNTRTIVDFRDGELLVSFAFDQSSVDRMKGLDRNERAWDPELRAWRVHPAAFDDVLDILGRGVKLTEPAYLALNEFAGSNYYAHLAKGKLGKLIVRESWFEQVDAHPVLPQVQTVTGSSADQGVAVSAALSTEQLKLRGWLGSFAFKRKPYEHQITGIEYLLFNKESALLDEMGCGKTFQIASALALLIQHGEIEQVLIVAPKSLVRTWQNELSMASDIEYIVMGGTAAQRGKAIDAGKAILITHYEAMRLEEERLSEWMRQKQTALVFDESQRIKNLEAQTTQAAKRIRPFAARCTIATGTPIANRPLDLFSQYLVMDMGRTFGEKFLAFKNTFCEMEVQKIQVGRKTVRIERFVGVRNAHELRNRIQRTSLRRLKSEVLDLPPVIYKDYVVELRAEQKAMYMQMRDNLKVEIAQMSADQVVAEASTIAVRLLRLSQIASNPGLIDPNYEGSSAKLSEVHEIVDDVLADDTKKIIIWSHFVQNVEWLAKSFEELEKFGKVAWHTGEMDVEARNRAVEAFQDDPSTRIFIATPQSAKEGLTLLPRDGRMHADTMIYFDLNFDSSSYIQSQARFHRIGQTAERCLVIHLLAEQSVDEFIRKSILEKITTALSLLETDAAASKRRAAGGKALGAGDAQVSLTKDLIMSFLGD